MWTILLGLLFHLAIGAPPRPKNDGISIGHQIQIAANKTRTGYAIKPEAEFKNKLISLFDLIDMNEDGIMDGAEFLKACQAENIAITETEVDFVVTLPDNTVGFTKDKFVDLLLFSPSTKTSDLLLFLNHIAGTSNSRFSKAHTSDSTGVKLKFEHRLEHVFLTLDVNHNCLIETDDLVTLFGEKGTTLSNEDATTLLTIDDTDTLEGVNYPQWKYLVLNEVFKSGDTNLAHHWRTAFAASDVLLDSDDAMDVTAAIIVKAKDIALATLEVGSRLDPCYSVSLDTIQTASVKAATVSETGNEGITYTLELRVLTEGVSDCTTQETQVAKVKVFKPYPQECHSEKDVITVETSISSEIICGSDKMRAGTCSCEDNEGGTRSPCSGGQGCAAAGNCLDVCPRGEKTSSECFCHPNGVSSGGACAKDRGCDDDGICLDVCVADTTNAKECFCKDPGDAMTGETCDADQGCDQKGECLNVCTRGEKNALACFCNTLAVDDPDTGVSCSAGEGCVPDGGQCLPVCALGEKNSELCFCHVKGGDTGVACQQDTQGCDEDGSCVDVCQQDETNAAKCFCKKDDDTGNTCLENQGCDNTGECLPVCQKDKVADGDCFCVKGVTKEGALCADGDACDTDGTCYPVCKVGSENKDICFCKADDATGKICQIGDGCTSTGSCTKTCTPDQTDTEKCLCKIPDNGGENLCQPDQGCDGDTGNCLAVCKADSTNVGSCFCPIEGGITGITCEAGQGCADEGPYCVPVCSLSGENSFDCFCKVADHATTSGSYCPLSKECTSDGLHCLDVCPAGEKVSSDCYCSGVKCDKDRACKVDYNGDEICLDVCTDGAKNDAECFCKNEHLETGIICPADKLGCVKGSCFPVCSPDVENDAVCFCTNMDSGDGSGELCTISGNGCARNGDCLKVCPLGLTNTEDCFCAKVDKTGVSCSATTQGCDTDGECLDVCISGSTNDDKCFCATEDGGNTCPAEAGCVGGDCLPVCTSDSYNADACFCENTDSGCTGTECTGSKCSAKEGCGSDGICLPSCSVGENSFPCFCRDTVSDGGASNGGDFCISDQECTINGDCQDVCDSGFTYTDSCFCKNGDSSEECSANQGCLDGNCLSVCASGKTNQAGVNCFCEPPPDEVSGKVITAGISCAHGDGCTTAGSCLAVCQIDKDLVGSACFCEDGLNAGDSCDRACDSAGACHDVCTSGYTNEASCLCKAAIDDGTGKFCDPSEGCLAGECLAVCTNQRINLGDSDCFCKPPGDQESTPGESCANNIGCTSDGSCLTVCEMDKKLGSECFCKKSGIAGDSCSGACDSSGVCHPVCTSGKKSEASCFCEAYSDDGVTPLGTGKFCDDGQGCVKGECLNVCDASPEGDCICVSDQNTGGVKCGEAGDSCDNGACLSSSQLNFPQNKCFLESSGVMINNVGKNHMQQKGQANWVVSSEGAKVTISTTTRPSVGTTELGHTEGEAPLAVRFTGEIITTDDTDGDVMGIVFGYRYSTDFFVVASSGEDPSGGTRNYGTHPRTNWYVARVHMTCDRACGLNTDTSDAIWHPAGHPTEITVLQEGTAYWKPNTRYTFAIDFYPSNLKLDVKVTSDGGIVLTTGGFISAAVTGVAHSSVTSDIAAAVDAESKLGGYIGLYVDSQKDTDWEALECQELTGGFGFSQCVGAWCLQEGTSEQYTSCEDATDGGDTCINPQIKYGSTEGGIPKGSTSEELSDWCKQIFSEERTGTITKGPRDCSSPKGHVYWCSGYDEHNHKWCDLKDGNWKDSTLDMHGCLDIDEHSITSLTCTKG